MTIKHSIRILLALGAMLVPTACASGTTATTAAATDLDLRGWRASACGDTVIYFYPEGGASLITISSPRLAARTAAAGEPLIESKTVGDEDLEVTLTLGRNLDQMVCNDAIEREPVVLRTQPATAGNLTFSTVGLDNGILANLSLTVDGLRFDDVTTGPSPHTVDDLQIGWYVG